MAQCRASNNTALVDHVVLCNAIRSLALGHQDPALLNLRDLYRVRGIYLVIFEILIMSTSSASFFSKGIQVCFMFNLFYVYCSMY